MTVLDHGTRAAVRSFLEEAFLYLRPELVLGDADDLISLGVIDSLGFVEIVEQVEGLLGRRVPDADMTEANFGSVDAIVAYLGARGSS